MRNLVEKESREKLEIPTEMKKKGEQYMKNAQS